MSKFKNMKIKITTKQPLVLVVTELERLGYDCGNPYFFDISNLKDGVINSVASYSDGSFYLYKMVDLDMIYNCETATLTELKKMV